MTTTATPASRTAHVRAAAAATTRPPVVTVSLAPYAGPFERAQAWHLLRRATFGATAARVDEAVALGLSGSLDRLVRPDGFAGLPLNVEGAGDPNVPVGQTWVEAPYVSGYDVNPYRQRSLRAWQMRSYRLGGFSAQARLSMFWHNHFGVASDNADARLFYGYLATLRDGALGSVRALLSAMTVDGAMLRFLNGNENVAGDPNENFARELLELYTLGKGPAAGPGDYTTFTEDDVRAVARALTGWTVRGINSTDPGVQPGPIFLPRRHDATAKQLSARLGGATIADAGAEEYERVLDVVFAQPTMGEYIVRKLYRYLVHYDVTPVVEDAIVRPLAAQLRAGGFEVAPVVRTLLGSAHFFEMYRRSAHISSPVEFALASTAALATPIPDGDLRGEHQTMLALADACAAQQQTPSQPPTVAGWKAYYQAPLYDRTWISATTLAAREALTDQLTVNPWVVSRRLRIEADLLGLVAGFAEPDNPGALIRELAERLFAEPLSPEQVTALKAILLPGLPDFEWTVEYNQHRGDPSDRALAAGLEAKLRGLAAAMLTAAEAHLS